MSSDTSGNLSNGTTERIASVPALAAALRRTNGRTTTLSTTQRLLTRPLAPLYRIDNRTLEQEAASAAALVQQVIERLHRLSMAYAEWQRFDASAYFDLYEGQVNELLTVSERSGDILITFFIDLLLPSFQSAERFWVEQLLPAYQCAYDSLHGSPTGIASLSRRSQLSPSILVKRFADEVQPQMVKRWQRLLKVIQQSRDILQDDISFLTANGSQEEREQWRSFWRRAAAPGLDSTLTPAWHRLPTLTLSFSFPMPTHRQPGRIRRLRANRDRRKQWRAVDGFA